MIGIFDSGVGGFNALFEIRRRLPFADISYFADEKNAPYGTKSEDQLLKLVKKDAEILKGIGASEILIACCTASTVFERLNEEEKRNLIPIIAPAARIAARHRRILVIATEATARSRAFSREILSVNPSCEVFELAMQQLVTEIEGGSRQGRLSERCKALLEELKENAEGGNFDSIVLGCTHFSHLEAEIKERLPNISIISPDKDKFQGLLGHTVSIFDSFPVPLRTL